MAPNEKLVNDHGYLKCAAAADVHQFDNIML